jgi:hypothetical protein
LQVNVKYSLLVVVELVLLVTVQALGVVVVALEQLYTIQQYFLQTLIP